MRELKYVLFCTCDASEAVYEPQEQQYRCMECNRLVDDIGNVQISDAEMDAEQLGWIDNAK